jgi:hypothetical protein
MLGIGLLSRIETQIYYMAALVGQAGSLRRVGNPPSAPVNRYAVSVDGQAECHSAAG